MSSPLNPQQILQGRDLSKIFQLWEEKHSSHGFDPEPIVTRLAEIFEEETSIYMQKDPDPFDERHPSRTDPNSELGRMLKSLFRRDHFMTRLVNDYLRDNFFTRQNIQQCSQQLNIAACRLILVIMPGLETAAVFQAESDHLITRLYSWAESSSEPLQSYATGLLGAAMEVQEIAVSFREQNIKLLPIMLRRLHVLQLAHRNKDRLIEAGEGTSSTAYQRMFHDEQSNDSPRQNGPTTSTAAANTLSPQRPFLHLGGKSLFDETKDLQMTTPNGFKSNNSNISLLFQNESNQSTSDSKCYIRNMIPIYPATIATSQMLILRYLTPMGEYQEFLPHVFEHNAMMLIFRYIENFDPKDTSLAFEALKYLASLLCHKKFSLEFISNGGLERLLKVPRPSLAATGVSIAFYYLAYCEDAMERICMMSHKIISELVMYALWLLGCSHDSARCHATMFFGLSCQFKVMMDEFDAQDGLRKLYNVISVLPILTNNDDYNLNDDEECAARQVVRHVCVALKKYFENHLYYKYIQVTRQHNQTNSIQQSLLRSVKNSPEAISEQIRSLQEILPMRAHWAPVDELLRLGGVTLLLRIIAFAYEWNYSGRAETVRSALDVLNICCVVPKVHSVFCERIEFPDDGSSAGINIILGAAEGEIVADAEVQKSALAVLVHTICAPIHRPSGTLTRFGSAKKKISNKLSEEFIQKIWESVRSNNGIIVLLQLMMVKTPITDADCIRGMACRALAGLARSETVKQIVGKLPLFTTGQLQILMRDPILQEKRAEHVQFQKYALELMERVSGKSSLDTSLANIHKANVVAQTKIQYNEQQLNQLIYQHLIARGLNETATCLQKEAGLNNIILPQRIAAHHSPFTFRSPNPISRSRIRSKTTEASFVSTAQHNLMAALAAADTTETNGVIDSTTMATISDEFPTNQTPPVIITPIKLIRKNSISAGTSTSNLSINNPFLSSHQRSLQKQITAAEATFLSTASTSTNQSHNNITLDTIITEYLTNQHALCNNPMSTCPQFDLFIPHKCPDPRPIRTTIGMCTNFATRYFKRHAGYNSKRLDRRLVHTHFSVTRVLRPQDSEFFCTCCDFTPCTSSIFVGSHSGEVKVFNINDSNEEYNFQCHESFINSIKCNRDGNLVLTSCAWRQPLSALWNIDNKRFTQKLSWEEEEYVEFSNLQQDKIIGTKAEVAIIYDLNTGQKVATLTPTNSNQYPKNRATFCPSDELILSDGVLWDFKSGREIHKFDKLNQTLSGVFHPNGLEVVSNTEVWDLRTFHLLRTVPTLDQCQVKFSIQNVLYGISPEIESNVDLEGYNYESSFKTMDSYDYSSISTVDVKRNIYDLSVNRFGSQIAIVENQGGYESVQESVVRVYSVGRKKNMEDEGDDDEEEVDGSDDSMSDSESVVFRGFDNGGDNRRMGRRRNRVIEDDEELWEPSSSDSGETSASGFSDADQDDDDNADQDDDDNADQDDDDNGDQDEEDNGADQDDGDNLGNDNDDDNDSWTTTSDIAEFG
uniref:DDB1- and CUL4-associated factor 1 n=1 Tax=Corethrella appendiculata TaxID=1370023 RepID=W4VRK8_9DIPT